MRKKCILEGFCISVIENGFVFVGMLKKEGKFYIISDAKNIRRWGTTQGLGELANNGPLSDTKLDDYGTIRVPMKSMIFTIDTDEKLWKK